MKAQSGENRVLHEDVEALFRERDALRTRAETAEKDCMKKLILKLTHRLWNKQIARIIGRAYSEGVINSRQYHILASKFDPTQKHDVY